MPRIETLQPRCMLAADFLAAFELEVLDSQKQPVSQVEVGDTFILRANARDLREQGAANVDGVYASFADLTFDANLVARVGVPEFGPSFSVLQRGDWDAPGNWNEIGAVLDITRPVGEQRDVLFEVEMIATAVGEVVFASNPADDLPWHEVLVLGRDTEVPQDQVRYGFTRLMIGDAAIAPWRNPDHPADVNADGRVDERDLSALSSVLTSRAAVELAEIDAAIGQAPFLDVNGDGTLDHNDSTLVSAQFPNLSPTDEDDNASNFVDRFFGDDFRLELEVVNLRTQQVNSADVRVGDVLEVRLNHLSNSAATQKWLRDLAVFSLTDIVTTTGKFEVLPNRPIDQTNVPFDTPAWRIQATDVGRSTIGFQPKASVLGAIPGITGREGALLEALGLKLLAATRHLELLESQTRPVAADDAVSFVDRTQNLSARKVYQTLGNDGRIQLRSDAASGILSNDTHSSDLSALLIEQASHGVIELDADGSFTYEPFDFSGAHDRFSYVAVSESGVSGVRHVELVTAAVPLIDIHARAVDTQGNPISSVRVGGEFFVEVRAFSAGPLGTSKWNPLQLNVNFNGTVADTGREQVVSSMFDRELLSLHTAESGELSIVTERSRPEIQASVGNISAIFQGFSLDLIAGQEVSLFRQQFFANSAGELNLAAEVVALDYFIDGTQIPSEVHELTNVQSQSLAIVPGSEWQNPRNPLDANDDGFVTPIDVLVGINRLNQASGELPRHRILRQDTSDGERALDNDSFYFDTNGDGLLSPIDVLLRVNHLNQNSLSLSTAEGEDDSATDVSTALRASSVDHAFFYWSERVSEREKREKGPQKGTGNN